ncbi:hypothetical protein [Arsenicicoccus sp. oral taxon 190]|uniref:hypothetical protein n=1 Tax=Arsenicicoccus sp. oral taxon 190 TaxID=1658671 RepID=UPI00067A21BB|nr:hypothetical protein [Arsenicicoccus sp. oral taxon 190]AKT50217.1 hypothetical protein ADJ73_00735 [Arsenicicoccus sp. oral taxon 190]
MQPSSLVFVVVIGLWAAYLTQSWMRRREHLQTARAIERYAEAMRVLDRPSVAPVVTSVRSYAASPLRARAGATRVARPGRGHATSSTAVASGAGARRPRRAARVVRSLTLLLSVLATVVLVVLAVLRVLPVWAPAVGAALVLVTLAGLRHSARRRSPRIELRTRSAAPAAPATLESPVPLASPVAGPIDRPVDVDRPMDGIADSGARESAAPATATATAAPFDVRAFDEPVAEPVHIEPEPLEPGQWRPVPVPLPTYTLKAPVQRSAPAPLPADDEVFAPIEIEDEFLDAPVPLRRAVGG